MTHRGCGWEVDPERGLNQATGPGAGGVELGGGTQSRQSVAGETGNAPSRGVEAAGLRATPAPHPLPRALRIPTELRATGSAATSWRGVTDGPPLGLPAGLRKDARRSQCAFCFDNREARSDTAPPSLPWARSAGAVGPRRGRRGRSGKGGPRRTLECAGRSLSLGPDELPGAQVPSLGRTFELLWVLSVLCPRGWRHHLFRRPSPQFAQQYTKYTLQVSDSKGPHKRSGKPDIFYQLGPKTLPVKKFKPARVGTLGGVELIAPPPPTAVPGGSQAGFGGRGSKPRSPTAPAALKPDPKELRIRFQNTAEPSRTNTPRCRGREGNHSAQGE